MTTTTPREGSGTRDWTPPQGEFRASSLGACPIYAWHNCRVPEDERPVDPLGKSVMMYAGHAAEHEYLRQLHDRKGQTWSVDVDLDNGFGGTCHPDALDYERRVVGEIKFTSFKSPAEYHLAQIRWYMMRMTEDTGEEWTGEIHLLSKHGEEPRVFPVEYPDGAERMRLLLLAEQTAAPEPPPASMGMCKSREDAENVKYYDCLGKPARKGQDIACPFAGRCFPPPDDGMEVGF